MHGCDKERHWQRRSSLPSSLIPHLLSGLQQSGYSQTRTTLRRGYDLPTVRLIDSGPLQNPVSPTSLDYCRQWFPPLSLIPADASTRHLDSGQPDVSSRLPTPLRCGLDTFSPPILPKLYRNPTCSDFIDHTSTGSSTPSSGTQTHRFQSVTTQNHSDFFHPQGTQRRGEPNMLSPRPLSHECGSNRPVPLYLHSSEAYGRRASDLKNGLLTQDPCRQRIERANVCGPGNLLNCTDPSPNEEALHGSDSCSNGAGCNRGESIQNLKKRQADSTDTDAKQLKKLRKTVIACDSCRMRKLRCNGKRPSCDNCLARNFGCVFTPVLRRRGPGKARKGSCAKKASAGCLKSKAESSSAFAEHELDVLPPEMWPYMAVLEGMVAS